MSWIIFAVSGYFMYSLATVSNKFLLRQHATTKPLIFTFWVCLLSVITFALAPFGLQWPGLNWLAFDLSTGLIYFLALLAFYHALDVNEASRAASFFGGLTPIFVLLFSYLFLGETLGRMQLLAFFILLVGGFLISFEKKEKGFEGRLKGLNFFAATIILHAVYFVMLKYLFIYQNFVTGFIWSRMGLVLAAFIILCYPAWRKTIFGSAREASSGIDFLMLGGKIIAGFGSLFISLAVSMGNVSLVNALQGSQYAFLFFLTTLFSSKFPHILREKLSGAIIAQKIAAIVFICLGLALIAL